MIWAREQIKNLRLRMGWEPSDLARRLNCKCEEVLAWEHGEVSCDEKYSSMLSLLNTQADSCAWEMKNSAIAEVILEDAHTSQIMLSEVVDKQI